MNCLAVLSFAALVAFSSASAILSKTTIEGPSGTIIKEEGLPLVHEPAVILEKSLPLVREAPLVREVPLVREEVPIVEAKTLIHREVPIVEAKTFVEREYPITTFAHNEYPLVEAKSILPIAHPAEYPFFRTGYEHLYKTGYEHPLFFRSGFPSYPFAGRYAYNYPGFNYPWVY